MKTFRQIYEDIAMIYAECYLKRDEENKYNILIGNCSVMVLNGLYKQFINEGIPGIETLPKERKIKLFKVACKLREEKMDRIEVVKAAYVLNLITSTE